MNDRTSLISLLAAVIAVCSCAKEFATDITPDGDDLKIYAELTDTKVSFVEDGVSHKLKGGWETGDVVIGLKDDGSAASFTVESVDEKTGVASLKQTTSVSFEAGDAVYGIFCPGKTASDIASGTLSVDFSEQPADVLPVLMVAESEVSGEKTLSFSFRNLTGVVGIVNPDVATSSSREVTDVIVSGHKVVSGGKVGVSGGKLVFTPDIPSKFITKKIDLTIKERKVDAPIYVVVPPCEIDKVTIHAGTFFYTWTAGKTVGVSKFCRADGKDFKPLTDVPVASGIEVNGTQWAVDNYNVTWSDIRGDAVKWGDVGLIYTTKEGGFLPGHEKGFVNTKDNSYWNGSAFEKYNATDGKTVLDPVDDIIQLSYPGTGWRMPKKEDWENLVSAANKGTLTGTYVKTSTTFSDGQYSFELTRSFQGGGGTSYGEGPLYWTSTLNAGSPTKAYSFKLGSSSAPSSSSKNRCLGCAIRPVRSTGTVHPGEFIPDPEWPNYNAGKSILSFPDWTAISIDYTNLTASNHPRLFLRKNDFNSIVNIVASGNNPYLKAMHNLVLAAAESMANRNNFKKPFEYELDASQTRLLNVSRKVLRKVSFLAYAYRCTEDKKFLKMAEFHIKTICEFPDWHPNHFLDVAEMATGIAIGYDWLYNELSDEVRELAAAKLKSYAVDAALAVGIYNRSGNWNQVCCGGMVTAAIADYENYPAACDELIRRCLAANAREIKNIYAPHGAFPEGPGYWEYGTTYQGVLNRALESALGTDFDLPKVEGFPEAGDYYDFIRDNTGHRFNYFDSGEKDEASYGMWYMAYVMKRPTYLYHDLYALATDYYAEEDYTFLSIDCAYRIGNVTPTEPSGRLYSSGGTNPIVIGRMGWDVGDPYFGIKGGHPAMSHGHMDIGEVVYNNYGTRWLMDFKYTTDYATVENLWAAMGVTNTGTAQDSYRWRLCQYNNRFHSTLTINDHDQHVWGTGIILDSFDDARGIGGKVDLSDCYYGDLASGNRTAILCPDGHLEITDKLYTLDGPVTHVRWTGTGEAVPTIVEGGIELSDGKTVMVLKTDAPNPVFKIWSSNPDDYDSVIPKGWQKPLEGYVFGFEYDIPASSEKVIVTTLKRK